MWTHVRFHGCTAKVKQAQKRQWLGLRATQPGAYTHLLIKYDPSSDQHLSLYASPVSVIPDADAPNAEQRAALERAIGAPMPASPAMVDDIGAAGIVEDRNFGADTTAVIKDVSVDQLQSIGFSEPELFDGPASGTVRRFFGILPEVHDSTPIDVLVGQCYYIDDYCN